MIEIVKEPIPIEKVEEPRNVRQIGNLPKGARVYVEDYVYRFLHGSNREKKRYAFVLLGEIKEGTEYPKLYIKGALELERISFGGEMPVFSEDIWDAIYRQSRKYFPQWSILGWAMQCIGEPVRMEDIQKICSRHFPGNHGNVLLFDAYGEWEKLYMDRHGLMEEVGGFFVYYEKNVSMSTYLSDYHSKRELLEKEETWEGRERFLLHDEKRYDEEVRQDREALARYRSYMHETQSHQRSQMSKVVVSVAVVVMILLSGVLFQNFTKLNEMEKTVASLGKSTDEDSAEIIQETISQSAEELAKTEGADASQENAKTPEVAAAQPTEDNSAAAAATTNPYLQQGYYIVEKGDKLTDISKKVYGTEDMVDAICTKNQIENGDHICAGDKLLLP